MAKSKSAVRRADVFLSDRAICLALAAKLGAEHLEFTFAAEGSELKPQLTHPLGVLNDDERRVITRLTEDVHDELILLSQKKGQLSSAQWRKLAATGLVLCLNLKHVNLPVVTRRRNDLHAAAMQAAALLAEPPTATVESMQKMSESSHCVFWKLPAALVLETLSRQDEYVHNKDVERAQDHDQSNKLRGGSAGDVGSLLAPAVELTPDLFLERERAFFKELLKARPRLTAEQLKQSLQEHLQEDAIVGRTYGREANRLWVDALADFLEATGLRINCIGGNLKCRVPSLPRYQPAKHGEYYQFKTQHNDAAGKQRNHGGPSTIPLFEVIFAPSRQVLG